MVRWVKNVWADARKGGDWLADGLITDQSSRRYVRFARWSYRYGIPMDAMFWLAFTAFWVLFAVLVVIGVL